MRSEFQGKIAEIRAVEDAIRQTKKYTEGLSSIGKEHPTQGREFPSKAFSKCYEIYPDVVVSIDMPVSVAIDWLWADTTCINARFWYDYRNDKASFKVVGGDESLRRLLQCIPGMLNLLLALATGTDEEKSLVMLSKTMSWIPEPADMDDEVEEEEEPEKPRTKLIDRLMPYRKKAG